MNPSVDLVSPPSLLPLFSGFLFLAFSLFSLFPLFLLSLSLSLSLSPSVMPFFKNLRRRSKASFRSNESKSNESQSNGDMTSGKSSSTLDTSTSITPPSSIKPNGASSPNLPALNETTSNNTNSAAAPPQRPGPYVTSSQRNSTFVRELVYPTCSSLP